MAVTRTDQGSVRDRKNRVQFFNRALATDKARWDALLAPGYDLNTHRWRAGHEIADVLTGLRLLVATVQGALVWSARSVTIKVASGAVVGGRLVEFVGADAAAQCTALMQPFQGVALHDAADGERLYVQVLGRALAETTGTPPPPWTTYGTDASGRANIGADGDPSEGLAMSGVVTVDGVPFVIVSLSGAVAPAAHAANADAHGPIGTITVTGPTATVAIGVDVHGPVGTITVTGPTGNAFSSLVEFLPDPRIVVEGDQGVTAPGGFASAWADQSPFGNNLLQSVGPNQPAFINDGSGPNGFPYLLGNFAAGRVIWAPSAASLHPAVLTEFMVSRQDAVTSFGSAQLQATTSSWQDGQGMAHLTGTPTNFGPFVNKYNVTFLQTPLSLGVWRILESYYDGANLVFLVNGVQVGTIAFAGPINYGAGGPYSLFAGILSAIGPTFGFFFTGGIVAHALDGTAMTAPQRSAARMNLSVKYKIPAVP